MKKLLVILCVGLMSGKTTLAQDFIQVHPPNFTVAPIYSIVHWGGDTIFAGCGNFTLKISTDLGWTWRTIFSNHPNVIDIKAMYKQGRYLYLQPYPRKLYFDPAPKFEEIGITHFYRYNVDTQDTVRLAVPTSLNQYDPIYTYINSMSFTDGAMYVSSQAWSGFQTVISQSLDEGNTWKELNIPKDTVLSPPYTIIFNPDYIAFRDEMTGLIGNINDIGYAKLYKTEDGGKTWRFIFGPFTTSTTWQTVKWVTDSLVIIGTQGRLYYSLDAGNTWIMSGKIPWRTPPNVADFFLDSSGVGYITGEYRDSYVTTDFGNSWAVTMPNGGYAGTGGADCMVSKKLLILGTFLGLFRRIDDGGRIYDEVPKHDGIEFLRFVTKYIGFRFFNENVLRTDDGGYSWRRISALKDWPQGNTLTPTPDIAYSITRSKENRLQVVVSEDTMATWRVVYEWPGVDSTILSLNEGSARGKDTVFYNAGRLLLYSYDRGRTWSTRTTPEQNQFFSVPNFSFYQHQWTLIQGLNAGLYHSINDGSSWEKIATPVNSFQFQFFPYRNLIFLRDSKQYHYSFDFGNTWDSYSWDQYSDKWKRAYYLTPEKAVCIYEDIWATNDQWKTYSKAFQNINPRGSSVQIIDNTPFFLDENNGWCIGPLALILYTSNGGISWASPPKPVPEFVSITGSYPNPVSPGSALSLDLELAGVQEQRISLTLYDTMGRKVTTLREGAVAPGRTSVSFPTTGLSPGLYFVRLLTERGTDVRKVVVQ